MKVDNSAAGTLAGAFAVVPSNSVVSLTAQGSLDWVHWGLNTEYGFDRKAAVAPQIGTLTAVLTGAGIGPYQYSDNFNGYTWTDGSPNTIVSNTLTGVYVIGKSSGFQLTVGANTTLKRIKVYVGTFGAQAQFTASLSDASATAYSSTALDNQDNGPGGVYTLDFAANSSGQTLTITFIVKQEHDNKTGNVTFQAAALSYPVANNPPTATLTGPTNNSKFTTPFDVPLSAIASDSDGTISKVEFYQGTTKLGQATNSPYSLTWSNAPAGDHLLRAVVTDNGSLSYTSNPVEIFINGSGGSLTGSKAITPISVDLTAEGTLDWAHWGLVATNSFNHKTGIAGKISNFTKLGTNGLQLLSPAPTAFSWSDGTPTAAAFSTQTGVFTSGVTNGFELTIPGSTNLRTLKLYIGLYGAKGNLEAWLTDFSAPAYTDNSLKSFYGNAAGVYTIAFTTASTNASLKIRYTPEALYDFTFGNVTWEAASLTETAPLPPIVLMNPQWTSGGFGFSFLSQSNASYTVEFTDSLDFPSWQTLTNLVGDGGIFSVSETAPTSGQRFYRIHTP